MTNSTTTTATKLTYAVVCEDILLNYDFPSAEAKEKFEALMTSITKKHSSKSASTPASEKPENVALYGKIVDYLAENGKATISEIIKGLGDMELSTSKVSSILKPYLVNGTIVREEIKRKAYFSLAE